MHCVVQVFVSQAAPPPLTPHQPAASAAQRPTTAAAQQPAAAATAESAGVGPSSSNAPPPYELAPPAAPPPGQQPAGEGRIPDAASAGAPLGCAAEADAAVEAAAPRQGEAGPQCCEPQAATQGLHHEPGHVGTPPGNSAGEAAPAMPDGDAQTAAPAGAPVAAQQATTAPAAAAPMPQAAAAAPPCCRQPDVEAAAGPLRVQMNVAPPEIEIYAEPDGLSR